MDKVITQEVNRKKRKNLFLIGMLSAAVLITAVWLLKHSLSTSIKRSNVTIAVIETGSIENTLNATGEVWPEFEAVITSPVNASIKEVLMNAGSSVKAGQSILTLEKEAAESEYKKLQFQLEAKKVNIQKLRLELEKSFYDLKSNNDIKQLRINSLSAAVEDAKRLYKAGGGTRESIEQAELNLKVAQLEKKQLENEIRNKQQTMKVEMRQSEIEAKIQENALAELANKLHQANILATRSGVVTWVNKNIGSSIREGESLARIADLGSFKVTGSISDTYIGQVNTGMNAIIKINDSTLRGQLVNIHPSVENGVVSFDVQLEERHSKLLRPNMKVDIFLVTSTQNKVMRIANGPAFKGATTEDIFIVKGNKAVRRTVNTGMSNFDFVEIKNNVRPGEAVITSDMSEYKNVNEITLTSN
jgi:HlyD family secretion protein